MTVAVMNVVGGWTDVAMTVVVGASTAVVPSAAAVVVGVGTAAEVEAAHRGALPSTLETIQEVASSA